MLSMYAPQHPALPHGPRRAAGRQHVICEKPLSTSVEQAAQLVALARQTGRRNCTFHNLRFYPLVQQMRRMREAGDLGEILVVQGTYSQDWLLYDTDWNWRLTPRPTAARAAWPTSAPTSATWPST